MPKIMLYKASERNGEPQELVGEHKQSHLASLTFTWHSHETGRGNTGSSGSRLHPGMQKEVLEVKVEKYVH